MKKKLTAEEIQHLREYAEKERALHREIMEEIASVGIEENISQARQLEIYQRGNQEEISALLRAYSHFPNHMICEEIQLSVCGEILTIMTENKKVLLGGCRLCLAIEKKLIDQKIPYNSFSEEGELYMVRKAIKDCQTPYKLTDQLRYLLDYTSKNRFCPAAETEMVSLFLNENTGRDSVIDGLERCVENYIEHYELHENAQVALVKSEKTKRIVQFINVSANGLTSQEAIAILLERADSEEVTAYFARYARG